MYRGGLHEEYEYRKRRYTYRGSVHKEYEYRRRRCIEEEYMKSMNTGRGDVKRKCTRRTGRGNVKRRSTWTDERRTFKNRGFLEINIKEVGECSLRRYI